MTSYDRQITRTPKEWDDTDECCEECNGDDLSECCSANYDSDIGICFECKEHCEAAGCSDEDCICHWTKEQHKEAAGEARYDAMRDDELTEK